MDRRSFIKLTAITGTSATLASCGSPENHLIRFVPEEELVPGVAEWKPGVCPLCSAGCGLSVRVMPADVEVTRNDQQGVVRQGVAKKLEGQAAHPVNEGGLCARGQAGVQIPYHPDRIAQPLKRSGTRGDGSFEMISWEQAIGELVQRLDALAAEPQSLSCVTGGRRSHRQILFDRFLEGYGAPRAITYELFGDDVLRRANALSFGLEQLPTFDLKNARFVLSFGADFLATWNSPVGQSAAYGHMRRGRAGVRGTFVQVESRMTTTGGSADEWVPVTPGTEGVLALGIAHVILEQKLKPTSGGRAAALVEGWGSGLEGYAPEQVEKITGVKAERIERLAHAISEQSPAVAIVGGPPLAHTNALFTALAVNALNELLGAVGQPGGLHFTPQFASLANAGQHTARQRLDAFAAALVAGSQTAKVLLVDGTNPVFAAPKAWKIREAFEKASYIVSFASFVDETSVLADLILPDSSPLESWTDALPESGSLVAVLSAAPPAMKPLYDTRQATDVVLDVAHQLAKPIDLPWQTFEEMLTATFNTIGDDAWTEAQERGGWWGEMPPKRGVAPAAPARSPVGFADPIYSGEVRQFPYQFLPYESVQFGDGSLAHLPWLQEMPDPMTSGMWCSWIEINPKTAASLGVSLGDVVEVKSLVGAVRAPAFINPAIAPDVIAMPVGQGHTTFTRYASGRGANPLEILAPVVEPETGVLAWVATRVAVTRVSDPDGTLIMFSARGELREHPHEGETR